MGNPKKHLVVGLMSGTSLDGLDICLCEFTVFGPNEVQFAINSAVTIPYDDALRDRLANAIHLDPNQLNQLDLELGQWIGRAVATCLGSNREKIQLVASHGHTVFHRPDAGITRQIGSGDEIHAILGIPVVCDFRSEDVALGGQGAPLAPLGDMVLFKGYDAWLNLGGFANISFQKNGNPGQIQAYDICAVNTVLNYLASRQNPPADFDENGDAAAAGHEIPALVEELNRLVYYSKRAPKSLGIEWVNEQVIPVLTTFLTAGASVSNVLNSYVEHVSQTISSNIYGIYGTTSTKILTTGGGAHNNYLISRLRNHLHGNVMIHIPEKQVVDYKESLIFGLLGLFRAKGWNNTLSSVTGASRDNSGGRVIGSLSTPDS